MFPQDAIASLYVVEPLGYLGTLALYPGMKLTLRLERCMPSRWRGLPLSLIEAPFGTMSWCSRGTRRRGPA